MLFPSPSISFRCRQFVKQHSPTVPPPSVRVIELTPLVGQDTCISSGLSAVFFPIDEFKVAKQFWQHSGDGVSSRRAEFCQRELEDGFLTEKGLNDLSNRPPKGPKRYSKGSMDKECFKLSRLLPDGPDTSRFVEERFGRNLGVEFASNAKLAVRRRIAGTLRSNVGLNDAIVLSEEGSRDVDGFTKDDVYLFPCGMSAIFNSHRLLLEARGPEKSVCYG
jgi:cystathionine gamma-synthase